MLQSASRDWDRRLFDESPEPTWLYDEETLRFIDVNRAALAVYGYTRDEFLQLTIHDLQADSADRPRQHFFSGEKSPQVFRQFAGRNIAPLRFLAQALKADGFQFDGYRRLQTPR